MVVVSPPGFTVVLLRVNMLAAGKSSATNAIIKAALIGSEIAFGKEQFVSFQNKPTSSPVF